jgi:phosphate acetyltransferase
MTARQSYFHHGIKSCVDCLPIRTAVIHPVRAEDIETIEAAVAAKLIAPTLIGPKERILTAAENAKIDISSYPVIDTEHSHEAAAKGSELAANGEVDAILKGGLHTDEILHAILTKRSLLTERRLSHAYLMDIPTYHKPVVISDAAVNIAPDLDAKADIIQNAIYFWLSIFGTSRPPKVALLAAVEMINSKMQATLDAAALCKMADRGQIIGGILDGPLAFDNAINKDAAQSKNIKSDVAGDPDILIAPNLESANIMAKELTFLAKAEAAGIILGARIPIILTSRADSLQTKLMSCALAVKVFHARKEGLFK